MCVSCSYVSEVNLLLTIYKLIQCKPLAVFRVGVFLPTLSNGYSKESVLSSNQKQTIYPMKQRT